MTYDVYRYIFIGAAVLSGIMLVVSVLLFVFLRIRVVIGDLSGANARKAIERIRSQNFKSGDTYVAASQATQGHGVITNKISQSGRLIQNDLKKRYDDGISKTEKISTDRLCAEAEKAAETTLLNEQISAANETTILNANGSGETMLLSENQPLFQILYEITFVHTSEIIS